MAREYFLKLAGIAGGSDDPEHIGELELASFAWHDERIDESEPQRDIAFTARVRGESRGLVAAFERHVPIAYGILTVREGEGRETASRQWRLTRIIVTEYRVVDDREGANVHEAGFVAELAESLPAPAPPALHVRLLRVDDLLNLDVEAVNLRLDDAAGEPALVVDEPGLPARLIVTFPPQTIAEGATFHSSPVQGDAGPKPGEPPPPTKKPKPVFTVNPAEPALDPPGTIGHGRDSVARIANASRLVFDVPTGTRIGYTTAGLLQWSELELSVSPIAAIGPEPTNAEIAAAPAIRPPAATETALELPYRLVLSPNRSVTWRHRDAPFTARGRTEMWHTRLALPGTTEPIELSRAQTAPLRAIWSPDYDPASPPDPTKLDANLKLTAMAPNDRHQIVILTSAFHGYKEDVEELVALEVADLDGAHEHLVPISITRSVPFVPQPVAAEMLMLSPLGGWLRSRGHWNPPYEVIRGVSVRRELSELIGPARRAAVPELAASAARAAGFGIFEHKGAQLDLSEWVHIAAQGRDHYVRIVYEGTLKPFGHRAALIKVTERKFIESGGIVGAYLIQRMFIVVREPERTFASTDRAMPFKSVRLTTLVTPDIAYPRYIGDTRSFWVEVASGAGTSRFTFHGVGTDVAGNTVDFTVPLMFVSIATQGDDLTTVLQTYNKSATDGDVAARDVKIPGQQLAFAEPHADPKKRNTQLVAESLNFVVDTKDAHPHMLKAEVHVPQVQELLGADAKTTIRFFKDYVSTGFDAAAGVFAEIAKLDVAAFKPDDPLKGMVGDTLGVAFSADKAGGFATPNLGAKVLTRALGPLAGAVDEAVAGTFDPKSFFGSGMAMLFGTFDLADLLPAASTDKNAPKLRTRTTDVAGGKRVTTTLDWAPEIQSKDLGVAAFVKDHGGTSTLKVEGVIEKVVTLGGATQPPTFTFTGTLTHFRVSVLQSVFVNFTGFDIAARSGAKPAVDVRLDTAKPVEFGGDLQFVEELRNAIPPGLFGDGPSLDISPTGVRAGFAFALPPIAVGVFALKDVALGAGLTLPFLDGKPVFDFNVSTREHPFLLAMSIFGGGGFFHLQLDTAGMKELEASLEFGATASLDIGVASGSVHMMAGIYFSLQRKDPGNDLKATLTGYLRVGGSMSVLGLITVSVEFNLSFTYQQEDKCYGRATLTVKVEVACFSKSVELIVERTFGGSGDPKFLDMFTSAPTWSAYAEAFA